MKDNKRLRGCTVVLRFHHLEDHFPTKRHFLRHRSFSSFTCLRSLLVRKSKWCVFLKQVSTLVQLDSFLDITQDSWKRLGRVGKLFLRVKLKLLDTEGRTLSISGQPHKLVEAITTVLAAAFILRILSKPLPFSLSGQWFASDCPPDKRILFDCEFSGDASTRA